MTAPAVTAPAVTVTGGVDGITATTSDIVALQSMVAGAMNTVGDVHTTLGSFGLFADLAAGAAVDPAGTHAITTALAQFRSGPLAACTSELDALHDKLAFTVVVYDNTESGLFDAFTGFAEKLGSAILDLDMFDFKAFSSKVKGDLFDVAPGTVDVWMKVLGKLEPLYTDLVSDGHPVVRDLGVDGTDTAPPRTLDDLIRELAVRDKTAPGEISVTLLTGPDGRRRAIVDIPGTKSWDPLPVSDVTSVGTDIRALTGQHTTYEDGVIAALRAAGVTPGTDVMLVGHSEGGIIAVNAARHALGEFHITHVITAGSPVGTLLGDVPGPVQVLSLENTADVMPDFDGAANPDRPNVTTVHADVQHDDVGENHSLTDSYLAIAEAAEHSGNGSVDAFLGSASGYLTGTTISTHDYLITRGP